MKTDLKLHINVLEKDIPTLQQNEERQLYGGFYAINCSINTFSNTSETDGICPDCTCPDGKCPDLKC